MLKNRTDPIEPTFSGKVRDIYDLGTELLFVASNRISAFDYSLEPEIPQKGEILTKMSLFWFDFFNGVVPNHVVTTDKAELLAKHSQLEELFPEINNRWILVKKLRMIPLESIVRGYLAGSGWLEYQSSGTVCKIALPSGLTESAQLPDAIWTPSTKAEFGEHDDNISYDKAVELIGAEVAQQVCALSLKLYSKAAEYAKAKGIIIADTKFEFGLDDTGQVVLADEVLTPDSSRFWPAEGYVAGQPQPSFDKQYVRDWLKANWLDNSDYPEHSNPPELPQTVVEHTQELYFEALELLTV